MVDNGNCLSEIFQLNVQGINPKVQKQKIKLKTISEIVTAYGHKIPFFILTETHLKDYIFDAELNIPEYNLLRADRAIRKNGGVAIYSHHSFSLDDTDTFTNKCCEAAMAFNKENNLVIVAAYKPPDASVKELQELLRKIKSFMEKHEDATTLMMGDMNLKFIDWKTETIRKPANVKQTISSQERKSSEDLLDFVNENMLVQIVEENTRKNKSILDIVLTNDEDMIFDTTVEATNIDTDHDLVKCRILLKNNSNVPNTKEDRERKPIDKLNLQKADWEQIRREIATIKWGEVLKEDMTASQMHEQLDKHISDTCTKYAPERAERDKKTSIPRNRLVLIRRRKRINSRINFLKYVKIAKTSKESDKVKREIERLQQKKSDIELEIKELIKEELTKKEIEAIKQMKRNPKFFYAFVKKNQKTESRIGPLQDDQGNLNSDPEIKANLLQSQYTKVFSNPDKANLNKEYSDKSDKEIYDIIITAKDIQDAIKDIPTYAAPGPDKLPAVVLKECVNELTEAISILWRKSLDTGEIPDLLKLQTIIPLYKKGSKALPENYRPVSLTSHLIKLFERVLRKKLIKFIEDNELLSENQHAFRAGRSCLSQLIQHIENILQALEENNIDVVYLDFAKAFDKVDHKILMKKVKQFGIKGKLYNWLESFITNRYQQVMVDGKLSRKEQVISGVPQGTVLGPLMFLLYINDLESEMQHSVLRVFADDSKIVKEIRNEEDHNKLQQDLNISVKWAEENNMELNQKKFQLMQYGKDESLKQPYKTGEDNILQKESDIKDLGVYVSENVAWETQTAESVKKARKYMWWILRTFKSRAQEVMLYLYQSYVIPRIEYASILWNPYLVRNIIRLEAVQRTMTSKIDGLQKLNYHQRLRKLKMYSMQRRRERFIAIYMYKIASGLVPNNVQLNFYESSRKGTMCHLPKLRSVTTHLCTVRKNYFTSTGPAIYNIIPKEIKDAKTLDQFKNQLDRFLKEIPDLPPTPGYPSINKNSILEWALGNYDYADIIETLTERRRGDEQSERGATDQPDGS